VTNRLSQSTSPYLQQHAHNPVDWHPWGQEALERARAQDKPIFLSIGYAACHWCHVMAHESFEDPDTAAYLNAHFVSIKVDREERPDLDAIYMEAVVAISGQGGWPMSVFLMPDGEPFFGGTYFPPTARHGLPAFRSVLQAIQRAWSQDRARLQAAGHEVRQLLERKTRLDGDIRPLERAVIEESAETLFRTYDWTHGGWGNAPKFPQPMSIESLFRKHHRHADTLALDMARHALASMAAGGIHDQLGGGFHRYATDRQWLIPHFEKMLYDNSLLARAYLHDWQITGNPSSRRVAEAVLDFLLREMRHPEGGLASSLDADSEGVEGSFYTWTQAEIERILGAGESGAIFCAAHGVTPQGNFEGKSILHRPLSDSSAADRFHLDHQALESIVERGRNALLVARGERVRPARDDKIISEWNGLALAAMSEAGRALGRQDYVVAAQSLGAFSAEVLAPEGQAVRAWRDGRTSSPGFLADHASLGVGLLALYQMDFDNRWFTTAQALAEGILAHFSDPQGGFFDTDDRHELLILRPKAVQDNAVPSGNALALELLLQLYALTGDSRYGEPAERALGPMTAHLHQHPTAFTAWLNAYDQALGPVHQLAIIGDRTQEDFHALAHVIASHYLPRLVVAGGASSQPGQPPLLDGRKMQAGNATAYLCQGFTCQLPTDSPETLAAQIADAVRPESG
jgi:hypothetical protein